MTLIYPWRLRSGEFARCRVPRNGSVIPGIYISHTHARTLRFEDESFKGFRFCFLVSQLTYLGFVSYSKNAPTYDMIMYDMLCYAMM